MELDSILLALRGLMHFLTFLIIASYTSNGARWRWGVSLLAVGLAGSSLGFAMLIATDWKATVYSGPQWLPNVYTGCVFGLVLRCRGNLAKLIPPFKRRALS